MSTPTIVIARDTYTGGLLAVWSPGYGLPSHDSVAVYWDREIIGPLELCGLLGGGGDRFSTGSYDTEVLATYWGTRGGDAPHDGTPAGTPPHGQDPPHG